MVAIGMQPCIHCCTPSHHPRQPCSLQPSPPPHTCRSTSFLTVSLPMCSILLTWSSTRGMSALFACFTRRVATCREADGT